MLGKNKATEGMASSWQELLANNAADMLKSSDEPAALVATLVQMMKKGGEHHRLATSILQIGWREEMTNMQNSWINIGVVAALVFSVLFSAINQPFGQIVADDMWKDHRDNMNKVLICLLYISTIFGLITVVLTIFLLIQMGGFVNDADDLLFFLTLNPHRVVHGTIVICLLGCCVSIILAAVVCNEEPMASICFFTGVLVSVWVLWIYVRSLVYNHKRRRAKLSILAGEQEAIAEILQQELEKLDTKQTEVM